MRRRREIDLASEAIRGRCRLVRADVYMQNPPGSNDRNRDRADKEPNVVESIVNWVRGLF